jgi:uncharacterized membrane protein
VTGWATAALVAAVITNGLMAGLFAAYSYAVMPGLARTGDRTFVEAMQQTNAAILNGWFGICFGGAVLFAAAAALLHLGRPALPWIVAGLALYVAVLVVTFSINVPLNDALAAAGNGDPAGVRAGFEGVWVRWNVVRAVASTAAFGCLTWALVTSSQGS